MPKQINTELYFNFLEQIEAQYPKGPMESHDDWVDFINARMAD